MQELSISLSTLAGTNCNPHENSPKILPLSKIQKFLSQNKSIL